MAASPDFEELGASELSSRHDGGEPRREAGRAKEDWRLRGKEEREEKDEDEDEGERDYE